MFSSSVQTQIGTLASAGWGICEEELRFGWIAAGRKKGQRLQESGLLQQKALL